MVTPNRPSLPYRAALALFVLLCGFFDASAVTFQTVYKFPAPPRNPETPLTLGRDGLFYGITKSGGTNDAGTIFKMTSTGVYRQLISLGGAVPSLSDSLVLGADGNFYGTSVFGGTNNAGMIFRMTPTGVVKVLFNGRSGHGTHPESLILGKDKYFYGVFQDYGTNANSALFRMSPAGIMTIISTNDSIGLSRIMQGRDGSFYGVRGGGFSYDGVNGGTSDNTTIFKVTATGAYTTLFEFSDANLYPFNGPLIQATNGFLCGLTVSGGDFGNGALYQVTTNGVLTNLYSFEGSRPTSPLTLLNNVLYGATSTNVYKVRPDGKITNVVSFAAAIQVDGLTVGRDGNLYCTALYGGTNNAGAVLRVTPAGVVTYLKSFDASIGSGPYAEMAFGNDGAFYGLTSPSGYSSGQVYKYTPGGTFTNLLSLASDNSTHAGGLVQADDGNFYGCSPSGPGSKGSIFRFIPGGSLETIASFDGTNGAYPNQTLTLGSDGRLYGVAMSGGLNDSTLPLGPSPKFAPVNPTGRGYGTIFAVSTSGELTALALFNGTNGSGPATKLVLANDGNFYGTTLHSGGTNSATSPGTIFKMTPAGDLTTLFLFDDTNNGVSPSGLIQANDGNLYGTTLSGGISNAGTIFKLTLDGTFTTLVQLVKTNGENPSQIMQASDGSLYGTTQAGGKYKQGVLYEYSTNGVFTVRYNFSGTNGTAPYAGLTEASDGLLYGVTTGGGNGTGVIFRYGKVPPFITLQPISHTNALRSAVTFSVRAAGPAPYRYQWLKDGVPIAKAIKPTLSLINLQYASAGNYSVIVSNADNFVVSSNATLTIAPPPFIVTQPEDQTATVGTTANFTVVASSMLPLKYQWQFKGVNMPGKTTPTLSLPNIQLARAGGYRVVVRNGSGSVVSSNAFLTVQPCAYTLSTNVVYIGPSGGSGSVTVTADHDDCSWLTANTNSWITLTSGTVNSGTHDVTFTVAANTNSLARTATILTAGTSFVVVQTGEPAAGTIYGKTFNFRSTQGAGTNFQFVTSLVGNNYIRTPALNAPTNYIYQKTGSATANLTLQQAGFYQLTYDSPYTGSYVYVATNNDVGIGSFAVTDSRPDYNNDGFADLLWQNVDGSLRITALQRTNYVRTIYPATVTDSSWYVVGQGDFNGDGNVDLLMQNTSGFIRVFHMQGTNFVSYNTLNNNVPIDTAWRVAGVRDLDGDGQPDILFQHSGGALWVWLMDGETIKASTVIRNGATPGTAWKVVGLADFNNDGLIDILFESNSGSVAVWYMNGTTFISAETLFDGQPLAANYAILGVNDFNSDGQMDLLLENLNGNLVIWFMTGINRDRGLALPVEPPQAAWRIVGPK